MHNKNRRLLCLLAIIFGLSACGINPVKSNLPLDLTQTGSIEIAIENDNATLDADAIKTLTSKNLSDWHYPIAPTATTPITHRMTAEIGKPEHGNTPTGFSFSIGNSDPRALDFQKANVLPITCKLESVQHAAQRAEINMGFADSAVTGANPNTKELTDHVSTVCFNLLQEIKWPLPKAAENSTSVSPSWMPEIRIETETEPEVSPSPASSQPEAVTNPSTSSATSQPESTSETQAPSDSTSSDNDEPKAVAKEITKEGRKVYIIHNKGNPIIFKFGHERK